MGIAQLIKNNRILKKLIHRLLIPKNEARPRKWVTIFVNPFVHKVAFSATIRHQTRLDVLPFNAFSLGAHSVIEDFSTINNGVGPVHIGRGTLIGMGNVIIGPATIGNNIIFAQNVVLSGLNHGYTDVEVPIVHQPVSTQPIVIEDDCWIAANVVITAGVTIGKHCVIAAGSVVTKDIPPYTVAGGNPAKPIKQYNPDLKEWVRV